MLLDHKSRRRDSNGSQEAALAKVAPTPVCNKAVQAARAPRASLESDGFSIQLSSKKDSYVSQMGNNFATQLHIKRISGEPNGIKSVSVSFWPWILIESFLFQQLRILRSNKNACCVDLK